MEQFASFCVSVAACPGEASSMYLDSNAIEDLSQMASMAYAEMSTSVYWEKGVQRASRLLHTIDEIGASAIR